jgi:serine phosphatase RsbU (regulator of sigma subunit)/pSer/pThr/pTyr-binding forkhead associated (FHA) protein
VGRGAVQRKKWSVRQILKGFFNKEGTKLGSLEVIKGPNPLVGQQLAMNHEVLTLGRDPDVDITLPSPTVSRRHARLVCQDGLYFVEDLGSTNGVFLNDQRITGRTRITDADELRIGEIVLRMITEAEPEPVVRGKVNVRTANQELFSLRPAQKLQMVLELSQHLSRTLDQPSLLDKLLEHLFKLFPLADQGLVALGGEEHLEVYARRARRQQDFRYSRSLLRQAIREGAGILSEDVRGDARFANTATLRDSEAHSVLCVPLFGHEGRPLGVLHLTCCRPDRSFQQDDLHLLSTIGLQVAVVLENAAFNEERVRQAQLLQELAVARQIQQSVLPTDFKELGGPAFDLFGRVWPAHEVSGDFYDFLPFDEARPGAGPLAFFVGDVSGKGMPAALFMFAVRALARHLALGSPGPCQTLRLLNRALDRDNPSSLFVTLGHGLLDRDSGEFLLTSAGHPLPLLRRATGQVEDINLPTGRFLGFASEPTLGEVRFVLQPGETLILYSDGCTETFADGGKTMFGLDRFRKVLVEEFQLPLETWAEKVKNRVLRFGGGTEPQDDLTLVLIHRR